MDYSLLVGMEPKSFDASNSIDNTPSFEGEEITKYDGCLIDGSEGYLRIKEKDGSMIHMGIIDILQT